MSKSNGDYKCVLTETEQAKFLGQPTPMDCNLGHWVPVDKLTQNPVRVMGKAQHRAGLVAGRSIKSTGTPTQENLDAWADYGSKNSYHGSKRK
jgi:hypothetical protein